MEVINNQPGLGQVPLIPVVVMAESIPVGQGILNVNGVARMVVVQPIEGVIAYVANKVGVTCITLLGAFKGVFGDMNATSDFLGLIVNVTKLTENTFPCHFLQLLAKAFKTIRDFFSARSGLSRSYSIVSGEAASSEKIGKGRDYLRVMNKGISLISDGCSTIKWLNSIGIIDAWMVTANASANIFGRVVVLSINSISSTATIIATIPNLIDNIRLMIKYRKERSDTLMTDRKIKLVTYSFDSVADICRIASVILFALSSPWMLFLGVVVSTVGTVVSLSRFYYLESTRVAKEKEKSEYAAKKEVIVRMAEKYVQMSAREANIPIGRDVLECIQRKLNQQTSIAIQRVATDVLVQNLLVADDDVVVQGSRQLIENARARAAVPVPALPDVNFGSLQQMWVVSA